MSRENIYLSAQKIQASEEQSVSDIYFNAVSVSSDPVVAGSENGVLPGDIAENSQIGGGNGSTLPFQARQTGNTSIEVSAGTVDGVAFSTSTISPITSTTKVYVDITVNASGVVTAVTVANAGSVPADTSTRAYVLLADVTVTGGVISDVQNYLSGSLGHAYGGGTEHILWRV